MIEFRLKMEDIESEIRKKRRQLDFLSNPDNSSDTEYRASSRAQSAQSTESASDNPPEEQKVEVSETVKTETK